MELPIDYTTLTPKQKRLVREEYVKLQGNRCMFCKSILTEQPPQEIRNRKIHWSLFPKGFLNYPIHLQHSHKTNMTEGAVHAYCNAVMWQYYGK